MFDVEQVFLTLTTKCNIRCKKCYLPKDREMGPNLLQQCFNVLSSFSGNIFIGSGENLIYPYLSDFIKWLNSDQTEGSATVLTNGLLLEPDRSELFNNKIKWGVTLDGYHQHEIEDIQSKNMDVEKVKRNIRYIKVKYPDQKFYLNYTLTSNNAKSLTKFVNFAIENGIDEVYVTKLRRFESTDSGFLKRYVPDLFESDILYTFAEIKKMAEKNGVTLKLPQQKLHYYCQTKPIITVNGKVAFCLGRETSYIGDVWNKSIQRTWNTLKNEILGHINTSWCLECENNNEVSEGILSISKGYKDKI